MLGAIASAAEALTRALARLDWRLAAVAGTLVGALSTLAAITFAVAPVSIGLWLAFFAVLALIGFRSGPVLEERVGLETVPGAGAVTVAEGRGEVVFDMVELPGGQFQMGAAADEHDDELRAAYESVIAKADQVDEILRRELPQHTVRVSGFRIMATPVTVGLYAKAVDSGSVEAEKGANQLPAVEISWLDAVEFCNRLSARMDFRPCYRKRFGRWRCDWRADGYRLPTEAEWEYACRAGSTSRFCCGDAARCVGSYGWHRGNSNGRTQPVATRRPNPWGIYDMHGNVWEWCWDVYGPYSAKEVRNSRGPKSSGPGWQARNAGGRVVRGGSFFSPPERLRSASRFFFDPPVLLRSANRFGGDPEVVVGFLGFRCVRVPPQHSIR